MEMDLSFVTLLCALWKRLWLFPLSSILRLAEQIKLGVGGRRVSCSLRRGGTHKLAERLLVSSESLNQAPLS